MTERKRLSDILQGANARDELRKAWEAAKAADEFGILPAGDYVCRLIDGENFNSRGKQTPGYKLTFQICEGKHAGRRCWHDVWLTGAALPMAKRELGKLGVTDLDQLDQPLPPGIVCRVRLVVRRDDDGVERNHVQHFDVLRIDPPEGDPFAPLDVGPNGSPTGDGAEGVAA